jgi:hypothetical protein
MLEIIFAFSTHFLPGEWNETHPGLRYEQAPYMGAFFMNSEGNPSLALGLTHEVPVTDHATLFGEIGGATGYSGGPFVPFARIGIEYSENTRVFLAPAMNTDGDFGAVVGFEYVMMRF